MSSSPQPPAEVVRLISTTVARLLAGRDSDAERHRLCDQLAHRYAERTDVRHPFDPLGAPPLTTRDELREHFLSGPGLAVRAETAAVVDEVVHTTSDPEVVVYEFAYAGRASGHDFRVPCCFVVRVRDGVIVESRDYGDHVGMARAFDRLPGLLARLSGQGLRP